jgi:glutamine cyclotransferase
MNRQIKILLLVLLVVGALTAQATINGQEAWWPRRSWILPRPTSSPTPLSPTRVPPVEATSPAPPVETTTPATPAVQSYRVVRAYPHDREAFTQGLVFHAGQLYEGTGLNGKSTLRRVDLETGAVLQSRDLAPEHFGEGLTIFEDRIIQLTWQSHVGFVYDLATFEPLTTFDYQTEGWGITHDGERLIMSDGTSTLHYLDPATLDEVGRIDVRDANGPVTWLNELEYVGGEIYANVWKTDRIARISPESGEVLGWIDLTGLLSPEDRAQHVDVLNGIAYDAQNDRLFVTGKLWPRLFEIELTGAP